MKISRNMVALMVAVLAVVASLGSARFIRRDLKRKGARAATCSSDLDCGDASVCLVNGRCGAPSSSKACSGAQPCTAGDGKKCESAEECGADETCQVVDKEYSECVKVCPHNQVWMEWPDRMEVCENEVKGQARGLTIHAPPGAGVLVPHACGCVPPMKLDGASGRCVESCPEVSSVEKPSLVNAEEEDDEPVDDDVEITPKYCQSLGLKFYQGLPCPKYCDGRSVMCMAAFLPGCGCPSKRPFVDDSSGVIRCKKASQCPNADDSMRL